VVYFWAQSNTNIAVGLKGKLKHECKIVAIIFVIRLLESLFSLALIFALAGRREMPKAEACRLAGMRAVLNKLKQRLFIKGLERFVF
jgi:hypothetical protein